MWQAEAQLAAAEAAAAQTAEPTSAHLQAAVQQAETALEDALAAAVKGSSQPGLAQPDAEDSGSPYESAGSGGSFAQDWHDDYEDSAGDAAGDNSLSDTAAQEPSMPDNFSHVDLSRSRSDIAAEFPDLPEPAHECELEAGEAGIPVFCTAGLRDEFDITDRRLSGCSEAYSAAWQGNG